MSSEANLKGLNYKEDHTHDKWCVLHNDYSSTSKTLILYETQCKINEVNSQFVLSCVPLPAFLFFYIIQSRCNMC